jgi:hypothetical protein
MLKRTRKVSAIKRTTLHYTATVRYDNNTVAVGFGLSRADAIRDAHARRRGNVAVSTGIQARAVAL